MRWNVGNYTYRELETLLMRMKEDISLTSNGSATILTVTSGGHRERKAAEIERECERVRDIWKGTCEKVKVF